MITAPPAMMNKIAIFGGGTIIGAAIIIVLPEAASILINAQNKLDEMDGIELTEKTVISDQIMTIIGSSIMIGFSLMLTIDKVFEIIKENQIKRALEEVEEKRLLGEVT